MIGAVVGNHRITARINEGGMGVVYRAEHAMLGRPAAVKVLLPQYSHAREIVARFFNEAKATSAVRHPNIVEIYDFGHLPDGQAYIVMEFLEGQTLSQRMHARPLGEGELIHLSRQIASALVAAHDRGVVHRDLKPDNVILVPDAEQPGGVRPKLVDFGIAKLADPALGASTTRTGAMLGTPTYMSPEQCRGNGVVDHRADIYALGCMMYQAIAGRPPFIADGPGEVIAAHLFATPAPLDGGAVIAVSPELERMVMSMLAKRPEDRPQSASAVCAMLDRLSMTAPMAPTTVDAAPPVDSGVVRMMMHTPTTLGGSAAESRSHQLPLAAVDGGGKRRTYMAAGIGLGVAAVAIAAVIAMSGGGGGETAPAAAPAAGTASASAAAPAPAPAPVEPAPGPVARDPEPATPDPEPATPDPEPEPEPVARDPDPVPEPAVAVEKPATKPTRKPARKPTRKPTRPKTTGPIETDL